ASIEEEFLDPPELVDVVGAGGLTSGPRGSGNLHDEQAPSGHSADRTLRSIRAQSPWSRCSGASGADGANLAAKPS
ncbi:hypothetical protein ACTVZD_32085, partial [Pseudomonas aeruginosa]